MTMLPVRNTWHVFSAAREILGMPYLTKLFSRSQKQVYRWGADPDFCEDVQRNPLDRMIRLIRGLREVGRSDVAAAIASMTAAAAGFELRVPDPSVADKKTLAEECLDDLPALAEYHRLLYADGRATAVDVRRAKENVIRELDENETLWAQTRNG